jgi:hypothetical protein
MPWLNAPGPEALHVDGMLGQCKVCNDWPVRVTGAHASLVACEVEKIAHLLHLQPTRADIINSKLVICDAMLWPINLLVLDVGFLQKHFGKLSYCTFTQPQMATKSTMG